MSHDVWDIPSMGPGQLFNSGLQDSRMLAVASHHCSERYLYLDRGQGTAGRA